MRSFLHSFFGGRAAVARFSRLVDMDSDANDIFWRMTFSSQSFKSAR